MRAHKESLLEIWSGTEGGDDGLFWKLREEGKETGGADQAEFDSPSLPPSSSNEARDRKCQSFLSAFFLSFSAKFLRGIECGLAEKTLRNFFHGIKGLFFGL